MKKISYPAKWVLVGEHAVLRGGSAIVAPDSRYSLSFSFEENALPLSIESEAHGVTEGDLDKLEMMVAKHFPKMASGFIKISGEIPIGGGLGSSAALCAGLAQICGAESVFEAALEMEHEIHGKSSGMDIRAIMSSGPIYYSRGKEPEGLPSWPELMDKIELIDTGIRASTRDCIDRVQSLEENRRREVDLAMGEATEVARAAWMHRDFDGVAKAMNLAQLAFEAYGLVPDSVKAKITQLKSVGYMAAKLTGKGNGGFLIALKSS